MKSPAVSKTKQQTYSLFCFQITKNTSLVYEMEIEFCQQCQEFHAYMDIGIGERTKAKWRYEPIFKG
jgi:hypothetical protein